LRYQGIDGSAHLANASITSLAGSVASSAIAKKATDLQSTNASTSTLNVARKAPLPEGGSGPFQLSAAERDADARLCQAKRIGLELACNRPLLHPDKPADQIPQARKRPLERFPDFLPGRSPL